MTNEQDAKTLAAEASFAVRMLAHFHTYEARGTAIGDLWSTVGKVLDSAWIEHQRLAGADVSAAEQRLRDTEWLPWRDLYDGSSDSETDEQVTNEVTDKTDAGSDTQRLEFVRDSRGRLCLAVPLDDPFYKDGRG